MHDSIQFRPSSNEDLTPLRRAYLASLHAPMDGMWEAFGLMAQPLEIRSADEPIGYCCLNDEGQMLQFFVTDEHQPRAPEAFTSLLKRDDVRGAIVSTADPHLLGLSLDAHTRLTVHSILYANGPGPLVEAHPERKITAVKEDELAVIAELQRSSLDQDMGDWLVGYLQNLISRGELYALRQDGEVLATGEIRVSDSQLPYADLGMITMRRFRGKGIAGYLLSRLRAMCAEKRLRPICSTTVENIASRRAIARAGLVPRHRLLEIEFETPKEARGRE